MVLCEPASTAKTSPIAPRAHCHLEMGEYVQTVHGNSGCRPALIENRQKEFIFSTTCRGFCATEFKYSSGFLTQKGVISKWNPSPLRWNNKHLEL